MCKPLMRQGSYNETKLKSYKGKTQMKIKILSTFTCALTLGVSLIAPLGTASATDVSDDVTYGMIHGTVRFSNSEITDVSDGSISGNEATVAPGSSITAEADYALGPVTDVSYCPGCIIQIYSAWISPAATNGATPINLGLWSGQTSSVGSPPYGSSGHFAFTSNAPTVPGVYYIGRGSTLDYIYQPGTQGITGNDTDSGVGDFASFKITVTDDFDGDGVPNDTDQCPETLEGATVNSDGCSIAQLVPCDGDWRNHGKYVSAVAKAANVFLAEGLIHDAEKDAIVSEAAESECGVKVKGN
jgi:hypothetical protein